MKFEVNVHIALVISMFTVILTGMCLWPGYAGENAQWWWDTIWAVVLGSVAGIVLELKK